MGFVAISYAFQQCKNFENLLRFDKVQESLKAGTFFETQCSLMRLCFRFRRQCLKRTTIE